MLFLRPLPPPPRQFIQTFFRTIASAPTSSVDTPPDATIHTPPPPAATLPPTTSSALVPLSYHVHRTASKQLPVYHMAKRGGNLHQTRIRKIDGRIGDLRDELQMALGLKDEQIAINQTTRHIIIKGWKKAEVDKFLEERRF